MSNISVLHANKVLTKTIEIIKIVKKCILNLLKNVY